MKILTAITATTVGGRDGHGTTSNGNADIQFALPKELGGAGKKKLKLDPNFSVTADVSLCARDDGGFALEVALKVNLPGVDKAETEALAVEANRTCPYSQGIRGNVPVKITVE